MVHPVCPGSRQNHPHGLQHFQRHRHQQHRRPGSARRCEHRCWQRCAHALQQSLFCRHQPNGQLRRSAAVAGQRPNVCRGTASAHGCCQRSQHSRRPRHPGTRLCTSRPRQHLRFHQQHEAGRHRHGRPARARRWQGAHTTRDDFKFPAQPARRQSHRHRVHA